MVFRFDRGPASTMQMRRKEREKEVFMVERCEDLKELYKRREEA